MPIPHDPHSYAASFDAMRQPYKTGAAFEGHQPRGSVWPRVAVLVALGIFAAILLSVAS